MTGRPTTYSDDMTTRICEWIAGGKSLRAFVRKNDDSPALSTICLWIIKHDEFSEQYMRAREAAGFAHADDILEIAAKVSREKLKPDQARVMIDAKKWAAERMAPKKHAPSQSIDHKSSDGSMKPQTIVFEAPNATGDD